MADLPRIKDLSVEELQALILDAKRLQKEKTDGVPTSDTRVHKLAAEIAALAKSLGTEVKNVVIAVGRLQEPQIQFRAYPVATGKPRTKKAKK